MIGLPDLLAAVLLITIAAYAVGGGTDYGAGFWDLFAGGPAAGSRPRALIAHSMAPVWEANNVWLVFVFVETWTAFPILWQSIFSSLYPLLTLGAVGLVLRGAGFAFGKLASQVAGRRRAGALFGISSIITPFCFAATLGAIASGRVSVGQPGVGLWVASLNPTSIAFGVVGVAATAFSGAAFLVGDARRYQAADLERYFRRRAVAAGIATLVLGLAALGVMASDAPADFRGFFTPRTLPIAGLAMLATLAVGVQLARSRFTFYRVATAIAIASYIGAWGLAQYPYLLPGKLTIAQAVGAHSAQVWLLIVTLVALLIVIPSLGLLYWLDQHNELEAEEETRWLAT